MKVKEKKKKKKKKKKEGGNLTKVILESDIKEKVNEQSRQVHGKKTIIKSGKYKNWEQEEALVGEKYTDPTRDSIIHIYDNDTSLFVPFSGGGRVKVDKK